MIVKYEHNHRGIQVIRVTREEGPLSGEIMEGFVEMFNISWEKNLREKEGVATGSDNIHIHLIWDCKPTQMDNWF